MKKLLSFVGVVAVVFSAYAQDQGDTDTDVSGDDYQKEYQEGMPEVDIGSLPEDVKAEIQTAIQEAEQARDAIAEMAKTGATEEEVEDAVTQVREKAQLEIQNAIEALDGLSEELKEQAAKEVEDAKKVLEEKKEEIKTRRAEAEDK